LIFITVGSLFPFDRLIRHMDEIAPTLRDQTFFAQIFEGAYEPVNFPFARLISRREFVEKMRETTLIVAHAGMGSVISAMDLGKPIVLVPRILEWGEHTTDHQVATARWLEGRPGVHVCYDDGKLRETIAAALAERRPEQAMSKTAPLEFIARLHKFIASA
jgi:UDP-N-acetylglucosamine transferase subunit ALG13